MLTKMDSCSDLPVLANGLSEGSGVLCLEYGDSAMKVYGVELDPQCGQYVLAWMRGSRSFCFGDLHGFLIRLEFSYPHGYEKTAVAYRMADRLIQRERRAGNIRQIKRGVWVWCGK